MIGNGEPVDSNIKLRPVTQADQPACESLVRDAFWDVYRPGCHEHYLWHVAMQGHPDVIPELTFVALDQDTIVGCIMSTKANILTPGGDRLPVLAPGPVAVAAARQKRGIGSLLMTRTLEDARDLGFTAAFLYGDPTYYPRFGFADAIKFEVSTAEGDNFADFMGMELQPRSLDGVHGKLIESTLFEFSLTNVEAFDEAFPQRPKATRPRRT